MENAGFGRHKKRFVRRFLGVPNHAAGGTRNSVIKPANEGADSGAGAGAGAGSLSSMTTTVVDPAQSRRREQSHAFLDTMLRELPASLHLQF